MLVDVVGGRAMVKLVPSLKSNTVEIISYFIPKQGSNRSNLIDQTSREMYFAMNDVTKGQLD